MESPEDIQQQQLDEVQQQEENKEEENKPGQTNTVEFALETAQASTLASSLIDNHSSPENQDEINNSGEQDGQIEEVKAEEQEEAKED